MAARACSVIFSHLLAQFPMSSRRGQQKWKLVVGDQYVKFATVRYSIQSLPNFLRVTNHLWNERVNSRAYPHRYAFLAAALREYLVGVDPNLVSAKYDRNHLLKRYVMSRQSPE